MLEKHRKIQEKEKDTSDEKAPDLSESKKEDRVCSPFRSVGTSVRLASDGQRKTTAHQLPLSIFMTVPLIGKALFRQEPQTIVRRLIMMLFISFLA